MRKTYNIAIVGGSLSIYGGGAPRSMAEQATALTRQGHHVTFFVGHSRKYPLTLEQFSCEKSQITSSLLWGPSVLGLFPNAMASLWKLASTFDYIHLNGAWNLTTAIASRIARARGVPYIITTRGHLGEYHFWRMPLLKRLLYLLFEKGNIRNAYAIHVTAEWERRTSEKALQPARSIVRIPNPVDLRDFEHPPRRCAAREKIGIGMHEFHVVHLGRLAGQKNLPFLVEAFAKANLGPNAYITLIGPPEPDLKQKLVRQARELGIEPQARFIDFLKGRERCDWLAAADVFALPSFDENFCIAAVESAASGTHSLLSPNVGVIEFLPNRLVTVLPLKLNAWIDSLKENYVVRKEQDIPQQGAFDRLSSESVGRAWTQFYRHENNESR